MLLYLFQHHRDHRWHPLWPIEVHELQDADDVCDVVTGFGSLHATVVLVATAVTFTTPCLSLRVPALHSTLAPLAALAVTLFLADVTAVKDVGSGEGFPLQWPGETLAPSGAAGSPVPEVVAPRGHLLLAVKIPQGLFVSIDVFQRAKELWWKSFESLHWLHRVEIVAPGAGTVAIQEFLADVQSLTVRTVFAPSKLPFTVVVIIAYLCGVGGVTQREKGEVYQRLAIAKQIPNKADLQNVHNEVCFC